MKKIITAVVLFGAVIGAGFLLSSEQWRTTPLSASLILGNGFQKYVNEIYGFSLEYPVNHKIEAFPEKDGAETIIFQGAENQGFQIFITPFEEASISKERVLRDIPGAVLKSVQEAVVGVSAGQKIPALLFWSEDPLIGRTREVWFVHGGYLYEITAYAGMDELLSGIMSTWRFDILK